MIRMAKVVTMECPNCKFAGDVTRQASRGAIAGVLVLISMVIAAGVIFTGNVMELFGVLLGAIIVCGVSFVVVQGARKCPKCEFDKTVTKKQFDDNVQGIQSTDKKQKSSSSMAVLGLGLLIIVFAIISVIALKSTSSQGVVVDSYSVSKKAIDNKKEEILLGSSVKEDKEILFDIGEWNKNNGETTTDKFEITTEWWMIEWSKTKLAQVSIEVFTEDGELYVPPYKADFGETSGEISLSGRGIYYIRMIGGTSPSAKVWNITVSEIADTENKASR